MIIGYALWIALFILKCRAGSAGAHCETATACVDLEDAQESMPAPLREPGAEPEARSEAQPLSLPDCIVGLPGELFTAIIKLLDPASALRLISVVPAVRSVLSGKRSIVLLHHHCLHAKSHQIPTSLHREIYNVVVNMVMVDFEERFPWHQAQGIPEEASENVAKVISDEAPQVVAKVGADEVPRAAVNGDQFTWADGEMLSKVDLRSPPPYEDVTVGPVLALYWTTLFGWPADFRNLLCRLEAAEKEHGRMAPSPYSQKLFRKLLRRACVSGKTQIFRILEGSNTSLKPVYVSYVLVLMSRAVINDQWKLAEFFLGVLERQPAVHDRKIFIFLLRAAAEKQRQTAFLRLLDGYDAPMTATLSSRLESGLVAMVDGTMNVYSHYMRLAQVPKTIICCVIAVLAYYILVAWPLSIAGSLAK